MGLLDFGDRSMVQTLAIRVGIGLDQIREEMSKSTKEILTIKAFCRAVGQEYKQMAIVANSLSPSSRASLKVQYRGNKIYYEEFIHSVVIKLQSDLMKKTQIDFYEFIK